jgi:hypothetical protein
VNKVQLSRNRNIGVEWNNPNGVPLVTRLVAFELTGVNEVFAILLSEREVNHRGVGEFTI